jgi:ubiquinone/menaquinone biosynthesis C-methylase UbiE
VSVDRHDLATWRPYLTEQQYADDANLAARQSIYAYQRPALDIWSGSLDLAELRGDESVLDVGCGNGRYLGALLGRGHRGLLCGADLSPGMLRSARAIASGAPLLVVDAQALPFEDNSFDVTLAMHMLYHVPDRSVAITELRRVLRPNGVALVITNSESHLVELDDLLVECARTATGIERLPVRASVLFKMDGGASELEQSFESVTAHHFVSELVVDAVAPVVAYARSMSTFVADTEGELDAVLVELERRVGETIAAEGAFRIATAAGCFVCR